MREVNIRKFQLFGLFQQGRLYSVYKDRNINLNFFISCTPFLLYSVYKDRNINLIKSRWFYLFLCIALFCSFNAAQANQKRKIKKKREPIKAGL